MHGDWVHSGILNTRFGSGVPPGVRRARAARTDTREGSTVRHRRREVVGKVLFNVPGISPGPFTDNPRVPYRPNSLSSTHESALGHESRCMALELYCTSCAND